MTHTPFLPLVHVRASARGVRHLQLPVMPPVPPKEGSHVPHRQSGRFVYRAMLGYRVYYTAATLFLSLPLDSLSDSSQVRSLPLHNPPWWLSRNRRSFRTSSSPLLIVPGTNAGRSSRWFRRRDRWGRGEEGREGCRWLLGEPYREGCRSRSGGW